MNEPQTKENPYAVARRTQLDVLLDEIRDVKNDLREIRSDIRRLEEKNELKAESIRTELKFEMNETRNEVRSIRWQVFGIVAAEVIGIGAIFAAIAALLK